ncbi:hypothetical protein FH972_021318 [Carpinus fangiana]|uniref:Probable beta-glucosidase E n=1 Tax=Carpinus fangiana TaxID=176857 RepID=A0A5N6KP76_9ROSI|nr:hypothetical protein FH972_021318 [Carpinus fangiana]
MPPQSYHRTDPIHHRRSYDVNDTDLDDFDPLHDRSADDSDGGYETPSDNKYLLRSLSQSHTNGRSHDRLLADEKRKGLCSRFFILLFRSLRQCLAHIRRRWLLVIVLTCALLGLLRLRSRGENRPTSMDGHSPPWYPSPRGGTSKTWEESYQKAEQMVQKMTLTEKVNITTGTGWMNGLCVGNTGPATNVGFPSLCLQDGPLGLRFADNVTAGPAGITVGSTWNKDLMHKRGRMLGLEAKLKGINVLLGPSVGPIGRTPLGGRNWEGFGIDPVLQATAAVETIQGIQAEGIMATIKHFVGNEQEHFRRPDEWGLPQALSSNMADRTLHELYAWPFADSVRAGVASVMCSYQQVNNSHACQNSKLLNGILKDELGFQGFVQSDWLAQRSGVASALAGLDMNMPGDGAVWADGDSFWGSKLTMAALNGSLPMERLNDMATRVVAAWYKLGQDDEYYWHRPPPEGDGGPNFSSWTNEGYGLIHAGSDDEATALVNRWVNAMDVGGFSHSSLARRIAAEGIVLLKNDREMLPLSRNGYSQSSEPTKKAGRKVHVGVFGHDAITNPDGMNSCIDRGCNKGTLAMGWGSGTVELPYLVSPLDGLRSVLHEDAVDLSLWSTNESPATTHMDLLGKQDLCIVFVNVDSGEGYLKVEDIEGDRNDLKLDHDGERLIEDVASNCGRDRKSADRVSERDEKATGDTIVVIHSVGPVSLESFIDKPSVRAVVWANLPGQESGTSLVDVLFGDLNPSGHLPYTIGKSLDDYGPAGKILKHTPDPIPQQDFEEGIFVDYKWFDAHAIAPRYEFGYGLSYTTFEIRNLVVESTLHTPDDRPPPTPGPRPADECSPPDYSRDSVPHDPVDAVFPAGWRKLKNYVYPYIDSVRDIKRGKYPFPVNDGKEISSPAGGREGGHPELWDVLVRVTFEVSNTGSRSGQVVPQLYVVFPEEVYETYHENSSTGGDDAVKQEKINFPPRQLRGFTKIHLAGQAESTASEATGESRTVMLDLTRRDLSYWSVRQQNWVIPDGRFGIEVGLSSRDLRSKRWSNLESRTCTLERLDHVRPCCEEHSIYRQGRALESDAGTLSAAGLAHLRLRIYKSVVGIQVGLPVGLLVRLLVRPLMGCMQRTCKHRIIYNPFGVSYLTLAVGPPRGAILIGMRVGMSAREHPAGNHSLRTRLDSQAITSCSTTEVALPFRQGLER